MSKEWKYNTLHLTDPISENKLKQMGAQSWELTGCIARDWGLGSTVMTKYIYYFKMPKETAFP